MPHGSQIIEEDHPSPKFPRNRCQAMSASNSGDGICPTYLTRGERASCPYPNI